MDSYWYKHTIFLASRRGFFFTLCFCTQNTQNFVENSKMAENHKKEI